MPAVGYVLVGPLIGLLLLGGCSQWRRPGVGRLVLARDRYECLQGASIKEVRVEEFGRPREVQKVDRELFRACMNSKGWERQS